MVATMFQYGMKPFVSVALAGLVMGAAGGMASADVKVASVFGDHMVLQRETEVSIWGWDHAGQTITITPNWDGGKAVVTTSNDRGKWLAKVPTPQAGGPFTISVNGSSTTALQDVMIGEVWLCSGQSNMEMPVGNFGGGYSGVLNYEEEISESANYPNIRLFTVENTISLHTRADLRGKWYVCSPDTVRGFSATGYFFGRKLNDELNVPIGLISSDFGGTAVQAWMSQEALNKIDAFAPALDYEDAMKDPVKRMNALENQQERWWTQFDGRSSIDKKWATPKFDDSDWKIMKLPHTLQGDGLENFDGVVYYRKTVEIPQSWDGIAGILSLGPIGDYDDAWVNGVHVGSTHDPGRWAEVRNYKFHKGILHTGRNLIAVRMLDTGGIGGINGQPAQMYLTLQVDDFRDKVSLAGEWQYKLGADVSKLPARPEGVGIHQNLPGVLYNGMISPIVPFTIRGAIWYQGESNRNDWESYDKWFAGLIRDWRSKFDLGEFPFYFVQIAPFRYHGDTRQTALLREAQANVAQTVPNTGMAVTLDIGNRNNIHPENKQEVGRRLALLALNQTFGSDKTACFGPTFRSVEFNGLNAVVTFDHVGNGLAADGDLVRGFMLAEKDKIFHEARAEIEGGRVIIYGDKGTKPVAVRYAWLPAPVANLRNKAGLPAAPFRSDNWSGQLPPEDNSLEMAQYRTKENGLKTLFDGQTLNGWTNVNCATATWTVQNGLIHCTGFPTGILRTNKMYENFILELEWRHLKPFGNAGVFVWSDPITAKGQPYSRAVEIQVMDGAEGTWYTSDGDIFAIHGSSMEYVNSRNGNSRSFPTEYRANDSPLWNHYRIECRDGAISLAVNGKVVTTGTNTIPRKGFICPESEGSPVDFRNIRVKKIPSSGAPSEEMIANPDMGFTALYNGLDFTAGITNRNTKDIGRPRTGRSTLTDRDRTSGRRSRMRISS